MSNKVSAYIHFQIFKSWSTQAWDEVVGCRIVKMSGMHIYRNVRQQIVTD